LGAAAKVESRGRLFPLTRWDVAGAFGDIGVLFPIAIALISLNHVNPTAVFLVAGVTYVLAGRFFQIPMAVQPFKAVAAIALATALPPSAIASAGLLMGALLGLVGVTNLATKLAKLFTLPIVRGIQLGLGLLLAREGLRLMLSPRFALVLGAGRTVAPWEIGLGGALLLLAFQRSRHLPAALLLLTAGITLGLTAQWAKLPALGWGPMPLTLLHPHLAELRRVLGLLVVPQFALTFGNSIVATENTAQILYGAQARRVTVRGLCLSIGLINLLGGMIQAAPLCHGSGGVTAHYQFGARNPRSSYVIGAVCILLALFGRAAVDLLNLIPAPVLGVLLAYVGIQHAAYLRDILRRPPLLMIAACVGVVSLLTTNLMWGFLTGFLLQGILLPIQKTKEKRKGAAT
jgi:SulP family sulfate permease